MWKPEYIQSGFLKQRAGENVYNRGKRYFNQERVSIIDIQPNFARFEVWGSRLYYVTLTIKGSTLSYSCTCPYAHRWGAMCKHVVAAALEMRQYLTEHALGWQYILDNTFEKIHQTSRPKKLTPYYLFFSLQVEYREWKLGVYRLNANKVPPGTFPENMTSEELTKIIEDNPWIGTKATSPSQFQPACLNLTAKGLQTARIVSHYFHASRYDYYDVSSKFMGGALNLISQHDIPLFRGDYENPLKTALQFIPVVEGKLLLKRQQDVLSIKPQFNAGSQPMDFTQKEVYKIGEEPDTYLCEPWVFNMADEQTLALITSWPPDEVQIPADEMDIFVKDYFLPMMQQVKVKTENIDTEHVNAEMVPRIYLTEQDGELQAALRFGYGEFEVPYQFDMLDQSIQLDADSFKLVYVHRQSDDEAGRYQALVGAKYGLKRAKELGDEMFVLRKRVSPVDFLLYKVPLLVKAGYEIFGEEKIKSVRVNRHAPSLSLNVSSGIDWFDVEAAIQFGDTRAELKDLRKAIKRKEQFVKLADGSIGEIPEEWLKRYKHLFGMGEQTDNGVRLSTYHVTLLDQLLGEADQSQADAEFKRRRQRLLTFEGIAPKDLPQGFTGELRPYQKAGFDWLHFLHEYQFGGCLADDMGLGKTVQVLTFLQSMRENKHAQAPDLVVVPRSLLVNWQREAACFVPDMRVLAHFGKQRSQDLQEFRQYDLILTTYGVLLRDMHKLREFSFHYAVLDESQAIKNPLAKTSKAARLLCADHRLVMTGTPVENSTFELWSQFAFLNPGLLGNLEYFKSEFGRPIEKSQDENASELLRKMVYPFILRRTKEKVAPELPPRSERILYCDMSPAQKKLYLRTRDQYRAMLMGLLDDGGLNNARMKVLEGLLRLRQISNHPLLVKKNFHGESAKFTLLLDTLQTLREEGHKALVFSQFVQMLTLVRGALEERKIPYLYLDGRTRKRQQRVDDFQKNPDIPFFLISLKAGGVGLNLTAADYVIHIDPWWNPAVEMQATDRVHRIGQEKPVFVYKMIARDSVEEKILTLQEHKKMLVEQIISTESSFFKSLTTEDVGALFS